MSVIVLWKVGHFEIVYLLVFCYADVVPVHVDNNGAKRDLFKQKETRSIVSLHIIVRFADYVV